MIFNNALSVWFAGGIFQSGCRPLRSGFSDDIFGARLNTVLDTVGVRVCERSIYEKSGFRRGYIAVSPIFQI